ncbi:hypothetical protein [Methanobacterium spitsbergense]|uniref:Uncharacterized protein n=1 Tax=Methanobacterium spitsbergense TaxID=2874285 RepID=A0A8T5UYN6_9EURY|nr:hypothetical protein [Methanobacterium spitsbergense]MBZ2165923.1 hypothetical protein [Methanobacterium spitsbergense]
MSDKNNEEGSKDDEIKSKGNRFLKWWIIGIILIFLLVGSYTAGILYENKQSSIIKYMEQMSPNITESGLIVEDFNLPSNITPTKVLSGIYVDRIKDVSLSDSTWDVDFYLWFKWNSSDVNPGENFQVIDGDIQNKELVDNYTNGTIHYEIYYVTAKITKFFDITRFPVDNHILNIEIEDKKTERQNLIYVPENGTSDINPKVQVHGYSTGNILVIEKPHIYNSNFGDPRLEQGRTSYSQLRAGIDIFRPDLGFYFRIFIGLFIAVAAALVALFIKPTQAEPRFGLGAGALFVAIANNIITSGLIPKTGTLTLADMVNDIGLLLILITIIESTISLYIYDVKGEKKLSRKLDIISFITLLTIYIVINAIIITSAW